MNIGLALQGGGGKGAFQAGAIEFILEWAATNGHSIAHIVGSSIGSFNGMYIAQGMLPELKQWWFKDHSAFSLFVRRSLFKQVHKDFDKSKITAEAAPILSVTVTDIISNDLLVRTNKRHIFTEDGDMTISCDPDLDISIEDSMRIPIIFSPRKRVSPAGRVQLMTDGGVIANIYPTPLLRNSTIDTIIPIMCSPDPFSEVYKDRKWPTLKFNQLKMLIDIRGEHNDRLRLAKIKDNNPINGERRYRNDSSLMRYVNVIKIEPKVLLANSTTSFNGKKSKLDWSYGKDIAEKNIMEFENAQN